MYNWSTNTKRLSKNKDKFELYSLEQAINFGLNNTKLSLKSLIKYWDQLNIDSDKKNYLFKIIWPQS